MTHNVDTAFDRTFSEPPNVAVSETRTHCGACKEPLDPAVMHQCHGNQEYQAPQVSSTEITEACPRCTAAAALIKPGPIGSWVIHVVICQSCRLYLYPPVEDAKEAIFNWNRIAALGKDSEPSWAQWRAMIPGDDERKIEIQESLDNAKIHPNLTNYKGVCPACNGTKGKLLESGEIDPCTQCGGKGEIK